MGFAAEAPQPPQGQMESREWLPQCRRKDGALSSLKRAGKSPTCGHEGQHGDHRPRGSAAACPHWASPAFQVLAGHHYPHQHS